jgi:Domain of unknown function (DUF4157)
MDHEHEELRQQPAEVARRRPPEPGLGTLAGNAAMASLAAGVLHRRALRQQGSGPLDPEIESEIRSSATGGSELDAGSRSDMENHLGVDLGPVRIHADRRADVLSRAVQADAFTVGTHLFFREGSYAPDTSSGRELLAHELVHVRQHADGEIDGPSRVSDPSDTAEREADGVAREIASSVPAGAMPTTPATATVARSAEDDTSADDTSPTVMRQMAGEEEELEEG